MDYRGVLLVCLLGVVNMEFVNGQRTGGPMHGKVVVCYVATWAVYRPSEGQFSLEDIDPTLCTHIVYAFAGLDDNKNAIKSLDGWQDLEVDYGKGGYKRIVGLKHRYPHLKVTIAIGGWNEGSPKYSKMAAKPETRRMFIDSVLAFLKQYKFDGLDLDWEYPTKRDGKPEDRANFVALVKELKEAFEPFGYILTAALGAGKTTMESAYDLARLSRYLDLIHMMCYDYHGAWDGVVGANAPLRGADDNDVLSVEYTIKYLLDHHVSPYKMVLGLASYGRTFVLRDPETDVVEFGRTTVQNSGFRGPYTREDGFLGYNEICLELKNKSSSWEKHWDEQSATPYLRDGARVVTYDDARSIAIKVKTAIAHGLGGLMVWSIDTDDKRGACSRDDAYVDFSDRHQRIVDDPVLKEALKTLNLHDVNEANTLRKGLAYVLSAGRLALRLPPSPPQPFSLLRTIDGAATLAIQEKRILDEMVKITKENEVVDKKKDPNSATVTAANAAILLACVVLHSFVNLK